MVQAYTICLLICILRNGVQINMVTTPTMQLSAADILGKFLLDQIRNLKEAPGQSSLEATPLEHHSPSIKSASPRSLSGSATVNFLANEEPSETTKTLVAYHAPITAKSRTIQAPASASTPIGGNTYLVSSTVASSASAPSSPCVISHSTSSGQTVIDLTSDNSEQHDAPEITPISLELPVEEASGKRPSETVILSEPVVADHGPLTSDLQTHPAKAQETIEILRKLHKIPPGAPVNLNALPDPPASKKPMQTLRALIQLAIAGSPNHTLSTRDIFSAIERRFSFFRKGEKRWRKSVRNMLSTNREFFAIPRPLGDLGMGKYWSLDMSLAKDQRPRKSFFESPADPDVLDHPIPSETRIVTNRSNPRNPYTSPNLDETLAQREVNGLVAALSSAFSHNANYTPIRREQDLASVLSSAFANNAVPETFYNDVDSTGSSSESDLNAEIDPHYEVSEDYRRRRRVNKPVPQIPSPIKRLRPKRTPKGVSTPPSEETLQQFLDIEYPLVKLPRGVSIAPENKSEYMDPDDEVLLDYDSSTEAVEERKRQTELKSTAAPKILRNNLRFMMAQRRITSKPRLVPVQRSKADSVRSNAAPYAQRVLKHCGERALDSILGRLEGWETCPKPKKHYQPFPSVEDYSHSPRMPTSELSEVGDDGESLVQVPSKKRLQPENCENPVPQKKVRFSDSDNVTSSPEFNEVLCGKLLQKLVKGKTQATDEELQQILLYFGNPILKRAVKDLQIKDGLDFLDTENHQARNSIWQALQHISQSAAGTLGIPELFEDLLIWEAKRIVNGVERATANFDQKREKQSFLS